MHRFGFIVHPLFAKQAAKRYPIARFLPDSAIEYLMKGMGPQVVGATEIIRATDGSETSGVFVGVPLTPHMMTGGAPLEHCYRKITEAVEVAASEGAEVVGLGAYTSVIGDGGITVADRAIVPITTGNSYTVATAIEGTLEALRMVGGEPGSSVLAVVGSTGSIGKACATILAPLFNRTILIGRDQDRTEAVAATLERSTATTDASAIREADCVVTVTSSGNVVQPALLQPGAVVCDVARPRDVSVEVAKTRKDVLVIEGGVVEVPGKPDLGFSFGFPPGTAYACMCETMMLALTGRIESYTLGKDVEVAKVEETRRMADRLGFRLAGFRSFEAQVTPETITAVQRARGNPGRTAGQPA
ncbi:MAG: shikimate dehydrogenase [Fimbriimonadaceae bacterium]